MVGTLILTAAVPKRASTPLRHAAPLLHAVRIYRQRQARLTPLRNVGLYRGFLALQGFLFGSLDRVSIRVLIPIPLLGAYHTRSASLMTAVSILLVRRSSRWCARPRTLFALQRSFRSIPLSLGTALTRYLSDLGIGCRY